MSAFLWEKYFRGSNYLATTSCLSSTVYAKNSIISDKIFIGEEISNNSSDHFFKIMFAGRYFGVFEMIMPGKCHLS